MTANKTGFFSKGELALLEGRIDEIAPNHRATYRKRLTKKVNQEAIDVLGYLPELIDYMESSTEESIRLQTDPIYLGHTFGSIYSNHTVELMLGVLMSEKQSDESPDEFLDRVDSIWREVSGEIQERVHTTQLSHKVRRSFATIQRVLLEKITDYIHSIAEWSGVKMRVPRDEFINWVVTEDSDDEATKLPEILDVAFGVTTSRPPPQRALKYWNLLSTVASEEGLTPPDGSDWTFNFENPTEPDYQRHTVALSTFDSDLHSVCHRYWEEKNVQGWDRLLANGLETHAELKERDKTILQQTPCSNTEDGWTRYHTRRANILAENRQPPLLLCREVKKSSTNEKQYKLTGFGRFVQWFTGYMNEKDGVRAVIRDFASDAPSEILEPAFIEIGSEDYDRWARVATKYDISE